MIQKLAYTCPYPNGYFPDSSRCDKFWECRDGVAEEVICPDGLLVNEKAAAFRYPCDYPVDVDCGKRTAPRKYMQNIWFTPYAALAWIYFLQILIQ